jgi:hypothetical protein
VNVSEAQPHTPKHMHADHHVTSDLFMDSCDIEIYIRDFAFQEQT